MSNILLGLQIVFGVLVGALSLYLSKDAVETINNTSCPEAGVFALLICSLGLASGGFLALLSLTLIVFP